MSLKGLFIFFIAVALADNSSMTFKEKLERNVFSREKQKRLAILTVPTEFPIIPQVYDRIAKYFEHLSNLGQCEYEFCIWHYEEWYSAETSVWNRKFGKSVLASAVKGIAMAIIAEEWNERYPSLKLHQKNKKGECLEAWIGSRDRGIPLFNDLKLQEPQFLPLEH